MNEVDNSRAKIGDTITIIANSNNHQFKIGQKVIVTKWYDYEEADGEYGVEAVEHPETEHWFVRHTDYIKE